MARGRDPDRGHNEKYVKFYEMPKCNNNGCGIDKKLATQTTARQKQPVLICPECDGGALELALRAR